MSYRVVVLGFFGFVILCTQALTVSAASFRFESVVSLDDMRAFLTRNFPLGTTRSDVRNNFVEQGKARRYAHPQRPNIEKYVYDINLCKRYVWRWNISANYTDAGKLTQIYVNGEPVHPAGDPLRDPKEAKQPGTKEQILKMKRPRPEASEGENIIAYIVYDLDASKRQTDDQFIIGAGPSRSDPANFGKMKTYKGLERWRSIFDREPANAVVPYVGNCPSR